MGQGRFEEKKAASKVVPVPVVKVPSLPVVCARAECGLWKRLQSEIARWSFRLDAHGSDLV